MMVKTWTIRGKKSGPRGLILGGIHGDEYEPMAAIRLLFQQIDPAELVGELTLVPIANQPAFSRLSRTGADGLDLARTFPGNPAGSDTERIAAEVTCLIQSADFLIDLHTGGRAMKILPLTGYLLHPNSQVLEQQRNMARAFNLPIVWGTTPHLEGRSLSVARDANIPAIYTEWGGGEACQQQGVDDYVQGCRNILASWQMLPPTGQPDNITSDRVTCVVEDSRENSGHLQLNYQAPVSGFYEAACELGTYVRSGDILGRIWQNLEEPAVEIKATQTGLLFLTRVLPAVHQGDCLATILETDTTETALPAGGRS